METLIKYILPALVSMGPIMELRAGVPLAIGTGMHPILAVLYCTLANMIPVPFIYFFARKFLEWGKDKKLIGKICWLFLDKGEKCGQKLVKKTGRGGLFVAMIFFVGIPMPGTGAWTGALAATFLNMGFKSTVGSVCLGVLLAGCIMALGSLGVFSAIGL